MPTHSPTGALKPRQSPWRQEMTDSMRSARGNVGPENRQGKQNPLTDDKPTEVNPERKDSVFSKGIWENRT